MKNRFEKKNAVCFLVAFAIVLQTFFMLGGIAPVVKAGEKPIQKNTIPNEDIYNGNGTTRTSQNTTKNLIFEETSNAAEQYSTRAATVVNVSTFDALKTSIEGLSSGAVVEYSINSKLSSTSTINIPSGTTVFVSVDSVKADSNYIVRSQEFHGHLFNVSAGSTLYVRCCLDGGCRDSSDNLRGYASDNTESSGYYGSALVLNSGTLVLDSDNSILKNNCNPKSETNTHGGGVLNHGTLEMSSGYISDNIVSDYGGGVYNDGVLELSGGVIESNIAYAKVNYMVSGAGGGIYSLTSFILPSGVVIRNNTATNGGGVYLDCDWDAATEDVTLLTLDGAEISGNIATYGGGVVVSNCNMIVKSGKISGNQAGDWGGRESFGKGGGIDLSGSGETDRGILTIIGGEISNNTVVSSNGSDGGGVYNHWGTINMSGGVITGNSCSSESYSTGGGVYLEERAVLNMTGGTISKNEASEGGGVCLYYYWDSYATFSGNAVVTENIGYYGGGVLNYNCGDEGGGIFIKENAKIYNNTAEYGGGVWNSGATTITGGHVYDNTAEYGGGVLNYGTTTMSGGSVYENSAYNGGGMYHEGSSDTDGKFVMTGGSVHDNTASQHGAGLYFTTNGSPIALSNCSIYNNKATKYGGGICSYRKNGLNINTGTKVYNNSGTHGGGVFTSTGLCTFNGEIKTNTASYGGGMYAGYSVDIIGGLIDGNTAKQKGGGIYSGTSAPVVMTGGTISNNHTVYDGGGIYAGATFNMSGNSVFDGNTSEQHGAGIYNNSTIVNLNGGSIVNNICDISGGGVYNKGTLNLTNVNINNNSAIQGAGVFSFSGTVDFNSGSVSYNTASNYGAGFLIEDGEFSMYDGAVVSHNKGTSFLARGAGVYNNGTVNIYGGTINNNTLNYLGTDADGNAYQTIGGGVYNNNDDAVANFFDGTIYGNVACSGGGVASYGGSFNMSGGKIYENTGYDIGGGISNRSLVVLTGGEIYSNQGAEGAGIYNAAIVMDGSTVTLDMSGDANVNADNEVYLGSNTNIFVSSEFNYDGLVAMIDCNKKAPGRIVAKTGYGNELGTELLYYEGSKQRFELVFDTFSDHSAAFLRAGDQGASSNSGSGVFNRDVFISTSYTISFDGNLTGYNVTVPDDVNKLWYEDLPDITFGNASVESNKHSFAGWNTLSNGRGETIVSPLNYTDNADLVLYAQWNRSDYCIVVVPKTVVLDGKTGQGTYSVKVKGLLSEGKKVSVIPTSSEFELNCLGKPGILARIVQSFSSFYAKDINENTYITQTGVINTSGLTAGSWSGGVEFTIGVF